MRFNSFLISHSFAGMYVTLSGCNFNFTEMFLAFKFEFTLLCMLIITTGSHNSFVYFIIDIDVSFELLRCHYTSARASGYHRVSASAPQFILCSAMRVASAGVPCNRGAVTGTKLAVAASAVL